MTNSIDELEYTDLILATGTNTTENHPVIGMKVKRAVKQQGTKLIDRKSTRLNSSHSAKSRMPSSA